MNKTFRAQYTAYAKFIVSFPEVPAGQHRIWECPMCGGSVKGFRSKTNGHLHVNCTKCGMGLHQ